MKNALISVLLLSALTACGGNYDNAVTPPPLAIDANNPVRDYQLDTGDRLKVRVFGEEQLTGEYDVDASGNVTFPLIGTVAARGVTATNFSNALKAKLREGYLTDPQLTVDVLNYRPFYIIGEVKSPGSYAYVNGMTVVNAVALAGGYTYRGKDDVAFIKRAKNPAVTERAGPQSLVLPGDVITVPERFF